MNSALFTSKKEDWCTPESFIRLVESVAPIAFDPCWSKDAVFDPKMVLTKEDDALSADWLEYSVRPRMHKRLWGMRMNGRDYKPGLIYINPPYGREIISWIRKMSETWNEMYAFGWSMQMVSLLPARTDTKWFSLLCESASQICFLRGRLRFVGAASSAPFPSMVAYWGDSSAFESVFSRKGNIMNLQHITEL